MALVDTVWYCNFGNGTSTGYYAVTVRPQNTASRPGAAPPVHRACGRQRAGVCLHRRGHHGERRRCNLGY